MATSHRPQRISRLESLSATIPPTTTVPTGPARPSVSPSQRPTSSACMSRERASKDGSQAITPVATHSIIDKPRAIVRYEGCANRSFIDDDKRGRASLSRTARPSARPRLGSRRVNTMTKAMMTPGAPIIRIVCRRPYSCGLHARASGPTPYVQSFGPAGFETDFPRTSVGTPGRIGRFRRNRTFGQHT